MKTEGTTQTHISPPFKGMGGIIHIAAWGILFGLPFFFTGRESQVLTVTSYLRSVIVPLSFMMVFYVNYFLLVNRYLFSRHGWKFFLSNVALIAAAIILVHLLMQLLPPPEIPHPHRSERELKDIIGFFTVNAMLYALVAGLSVAIKMTSGWYQIESMRRELEKSRAEAELQNLKSQLNPHFLFNTLNSLYSLVVGTSPKAEDAFIKFTELLRYTYVTAENDEVPIREEINYINNYIDLQLLRLNGRTNVIWNCSIDDENTVIPPMIFLTFVENTFKYGASANRNCDIIISLRLENGILVFETENRIMKHSDEFRKDMPTGINNCRSRLSVLFPDRYTLDIKEEGEVFKVRLQINLCRNE